MNETRCAVVLALLLAPTGCGDDSAGSGGAGGGGTSTATQATTGQSTSIAATTSAAATGSGGQPGTGGATGSGGEGGAGGGAVEGCAEPSGEGTLHEGVIDADETWTAAGSPHIVTFDTFVDGATLTIEPCAVVRIEKGYTISVDGEPDAPGAIVAHGEVLAEDTFGPVIFERQVEDEPWGALLVHRDGLLDLEHVTLRGGGDPDTAVSGGGSLVATGDAATQGVFVNVRVVDVRIEDSGTHGANLTTRAAFSDDSESLVIVGADEGFPLLIHGGAVGTIPEGEYTGNGTDQILVQNATSLADDAITFRDRGVPYQLQGGFSIAPVDSAADGGLSTVTLEAGVVLVFDADASTVASFGLGTSNGTAAENIWPVRLVAEGTADAPVVLTSAEDAPAAGDWAGIEWAGGPATGNVMSHVHIEYAGGDSGTSGFGCGPADNDAALVITNWRPEDAFITDSTFADSADGGIVSGWYSDEDGPNLRGTGNTFTNIANGCDVSRWRDADSGCPDTPPLCL